MSPPPTSIDGTDITGATIDGQDVEEITVDGQTVFTSGVIPNLVDIRFRMDEGSGTTLNDEFSSNTATLKNGAGFQADPDWTGGFKTTYDDSQDQFWVSDSKLPVNETNQTIMLWWEWDGTENGQYWPPVFMSPTQTPTLDDGGWTIQYDSNNGAFLYIAHRSGGNYTGNTASGYQIDANEPYFLAWTFSGNTSRYRVYENNNGLQQVYDRTLTATRGSQGTDFFLAGNRGHEDRYFGGFMDDIMVNTTTALTESEIESIANETLR
jgi:hypothetical protein